MKKTFFFVFAFVAMVATMLVSCEPEETLTEPDVTDTIPGGKDTIPTLPDTIPGGKDTIPTLPDDTIPGDKDTIVVNMETMKLCSAIYFGDYYENGTENFGFELATGTTDFDEEGNFIGSGKYLVLDLNSDSREFPTEGVYEINNTSDAKTLIAGELVKDPEYGDYCEGSYIINVVNGEEKEMVPITEGQMIVKGDITNAEFTLKAKLENGDSLCAKFEGLMEEIVDYFYTYEPHETHNVDVKFDTCKISLTPEDSTIYVSMTTTAGDYVAGFYGYGSSDKEVLGNYTLDFSGEKGTFDASSGWIDYYPIYAGPVESYVAHIDSEGYIDQIFYLETGDVVISKEGMTFNAKSHYGSQVKGSFVGATTPKVEQPQQVQAKAPMKNNKHMSTKRALRLSK